ncbi:hypothetical protein FHW96_000199 [Novosphingobium sp. SG751A]|uniref:hypothetical protein n=1 Tax=Novosphingobium sp. SG751A TaxID=2587000 RepID=UPI00155172B7|nr:hypothetical protein [Novosphingobium sp. SG751A]NOW44072.1 hypothetical protein [Novosphingobium sp. SG751A]
MADPAIPLLSDLRTPPVIRRTYMVPVVHFIYLNREDDWPVLGPMHTDAKHFNFPEPHYHIDARFLTADQARLVRNYMRGSRLADGFDPLAVTVSGLPLAKRRVANPVEVPKGRPELKALRCSRKTPIYPFGDRPPMQALRAEYSDPAIPIQKPDGRLLCPHRKVDLSSFAPDADGVVVCPLHGLRVHCAQRAAA